MIQWSLRQSWWLIISYSLEWFSAFEIFIIFEGAWIHILMLSNPRLNEHVIYTILQCLYLEVFSAFTRVEPATFSQQESLLHRCLSQWPRTPNYSNNIHGLKYPNLAYPSRPFPSFPRTAFPCPSNSITLLPIPFLFASKISFFATSTSQVWRYCGISWSEVRQNTSMAESTRPVEYWRNERLLSQLQLIDLLLTLDSMVFQRVLSKILVSMVTNHRGTYHCRQIGLKEVAGSVATHLLETSFPALSPSSGECWKVLVFGRKMGVGQAIVVVNHASGNNILHPRWRLVETTLSHSHHRQVLLILSAASRWFKDDVEVGRWLARLAKRGALVSSNFALEGRNCEKLWITPIIYLCSKRFRRLW